ncbi:F-box domain-containing protein [Colletotrichum musicola]|uniref:F-box domain-containing protein n=1 Tax=Colletotrichum musicola TaxID=2175873 RepID=A0A8H6K8D7_9PEZI|nr:F-box domain-containing protein [Colletotrichum musicola]
MPQLTKLPNEVVHQILANCKRSPSKHQEKGRSTLWQMALADRWLRRMAVPLLFQELKKEISDEVEFHDSLITIAQNPAILISVQSKVANDHETVRLDVYSFRIFHLLIYILENMTRLTNLRVNLEGVPGRRLMFMREIFDKVMEHMNPLPALKALIYTTTPPSTPTTIPTFSPGLEVLSIQVEHAPSETPGLMGLAGQLNLRAVELSKPTWSMDDVYEVVQMLPSIRHLVLVGELAGETTVGDLIEILARLPRIEDFYLDESGQRKGFGHFNYREVLEELASSNELSREIPIAEALFQSCPNLQTASFPTIDDGWVNTNYVMDWEWEEEDGDEERGYVARIMDVSYRPAINEFPWE